jgi:hypothetical protein
MRNEDRLHEVLLLTRLEQTASLIWNFQIQIEQAE